MISEVVNKFLNSWHKPTHCARKSFRFIVVRNVMIASLESHINFKDFKVTSQFKIVISTAWWGGNHILILLNVQYILGSTF